MFKIESGVEQVLSRLDYLGLKFKALADKEKMLLAAANYGSTVHVENLLNVVDDKDVLGAALLLATLHGKHKVVEVISGLNDVNVNLSDKYGNNALLYSSRFIDGKVAKRLATIKNIDINPKDQNGNTPLLLAIHHDVRDVLDAVIEHPNIDINIMNHFNMNALFLSIYMLNSYAFKKILNHKNLNLHLHNKFGDDALAFSLRYKNIVAAKEIITHPSFRHDRANNKNLMRLIRSDDYLLKNAMEIFIMLEKGVMGAIGCSSKDVLAHHGRI